MLFFVSKFFFTVRSVDKAGEPVPAGEPDPAGEPRNVPRSYGARGAGTRAVQLVKENQLHQDDASLDLMKTVPR